MIRIEEIKAQLEAITPGEWEWWTSCSWRRLGVKDDYGNHVIRPWVASDGHPDIECTPGDRDFIAHAPENIRYLLARVEELENIMCDKICIPRKHCVNCTEYGKVCRASKEKYNERKR